MINWSPDRAVEEDDLFVAWRADRSVPTEVRFVFMRLSPLSSAEQEERWIVGVLETLLRDRFDRFEA